MNFIKAGTDSQGHPVELFYQDLGQGSPVVLIHGWPLDSQSWEHQLLELPQHGLRVIAYDRRGFGKSSKPWDGYDYDTFASDLKAVLDELDLQDVTLVGFSMGGGEIARYMSRYNGARVSKVAFVSAVTPFMLKTDDNPSGVDKSVFDEMIEGVKKDRADFLTSFGKQFFGVGLLDHSVSQATLDWMQSIALQATPKATLDCIYAFASTDFRQDLASVKVPALIIHGTSDKIVPIESGGEQTAQLLPQAQYLEYDGAPHGLNVTEKDRLNQDLLAFVGQPASTTTASSAY
ncbi:alpha/beta fold hydrolase [Hymenobacter crusticola]|uniref:Alpha/beta hydrolase n=1 Tax=Hymenobacter crusticola TaxID=1770526 RepID=A0A243WKH3_9BACT|nr:alpha/beta hydrolase [Hymenobacter crusticola]OUJ75614.1 alpha/beta hydrolase [Hymenobacter crusticola]